MTAPPNAALVAPELIMRRHGSQVSVEQKMAPCRFLLEQLPFGAKRVPAWTGSNFDTFEIDNFPTEVGRRRPAHFRGARQAGDLAKEA